MHPAPAGRGPGRGRPVACAGTVAPGAGAGTVYRHFPNRGALVGALSAARFRELVVEAQTAVAAENPRAGLRRLLRFGPDRMLGECPRPPHRHP